VLLAFDKVYYFLPGYILANVIAHAHLAAIGWGVEMMVCIAYRLIPMLLPSALPQGKTMYVSAILLETALGGTAALLAYVSGAAVMTVRQWTLLITGFNRRRTVSRAGSAPPRRAAVLQRVCARPAALAARHLLFAPG
jgi:hypothetical protein